MTNTGHKCCATTKTGNECPIYADRNRGGLMYCHVHDPLGVYQKQQQMKRSGRSFERCPTCGHLLEDERHSEPLRADISTPKIAVFDAETRFDPRSWKDRIAAGEAEPDLSTVPPFEPTGDY